MKYYIGEEVECKSTNQNYIIKDYEKIGDCKLYYFESGSVYLKIKFLKVFSSIKKLFLYLKEKDMRLERVLENLDRKLSIKLGIGFTSSYTRIPFEFWSIGLACLL